jgi:hypothetical protein
MVNIPETAREIGQVLSPKERLSSAIGKARETIQTHGASVKQEIGRLAGDYKEMYGSALATPFKAGGELLKLNPIQSMGELVDGASKTLGSMADIVTSPLRLAVAGGRTTKEGVKKAVLFPPKALATVAKTPLTVFNTLQRGFSKMSSPLSGGPAPAPTPAI